MSLCTRVTNKKLTNLKFLSTYLKITVDLKARKLLKRPSFGIYTCLTSHSIIRLLGLSDKKRSSNENNIALIKIENSYLPNYPDGIFIKFNGNCMI